MCKGRLTSGVWNRNLRGERSRSDSFRSNSFRSNAATHACAAPACIVTRPSDVGTLTGQHALHAVRGAGLAVRASVEQTVACMASVMLARPARRDRPRRPRHALDLPGAGVGLTLVQHALYNMMLSFSV